MAWLSLAGVLLFWLTWLLRCVHGIAWTEVQWMENHIPPDALDWIELSTLRCLCISYLGFSMNCIALTLEGFFPVLLWITAPGLLANVAEQDSKMWVLEWRYYFVSQGRTVTARLFYLHLLQNPPYQVSVQRYQWSTPWRVLALHLEQLGLICKEVKVASRQKSQTQSRWGSYAGWLRYLLSAV